MKKDTRKRLEIALRRNRVAQLAVIERLTQQAIAKKLKMSQPQVSLDYRAWLSLSQA